MLATIRRAELTDVDGLADFLINLNYFRRLEGLSAEQVRERVLAHLTLAFADGSHSVYVAEAAGGGVAGYAAVHWLPYLFLPGPVGYVSELFVAQCARGQGTGTQLLATVREEARARGCSRLSLLNMRERESYVRRFYAKDGWEERPDAANFVFDMSYPLSA